jgi:hypothetical protein
VGFGILFRGILKALEGLGNVTGVHLTAHREAKRQKDRPFPLPGAIRAFRIRFDNPYYLRISGSMVFRLSMTGRLSFAVFQSFISSIEEYHATN